MYVVDSNPKIKKFGSTKELGKFMDDFWKKYPDHLAADSGNWIDYCVTEVSGDVHFFTDGLEVE